MKRLIAINVAWNAFFVLMGLSEMIGLTGIHEHLPPWGKWVWLIALAGGNLIIHALQWRKTGSMIESTNLQPIYRDEPRYGDELVRPKDWTRP